MLTRDKNENRSTFDKVIEHQWAYFGGTQCTCSWCCYYLSVSLSIDVRQSVVAAMTWVNVRCTTVQRTLTQVMAAQTLALPFVISYDCCER